MRALLSRRWTGNVRELANLCQRMILLRSSDELTEADLPPEEGPAENDVASHPSSRFLGELPPDRLPLRDVEREIILRALERHGGNRTRTAEYLGIPRHILLYRLAKFGISKTDPI
jgi:two-component system NtrC family response regulator